MNIKKRLSILLIGIFIVLLASCSGGIDRDEAKVFIGNFLEAVETEDYAKAETFLHPERPADLEAFFTGVENKENIDFQAGITIEKYTGYSSSYYDSTVGGSTCKLTMKAKVGESDVKMTIEIVQNDNGYGIYNFNIDT